MSGKWRLRSWCAGGVLGVLVSAASAEIKIGAASAVTPEPAPKTVPAVMVPVKGYADELRLENGDLLHGTLLAIKGGADGGLTWKHERAMAPVEFTLAGMDTVVLGERAKEGARVHRGSLWLTNGDVLVGDLVSLDGQNLVLDTWYAGKLTIPRTLVRRMEPWTSLNVPLYSGPAATLEGWKTASGDIKDYWECRDGSLVALQGGSTISREIPELPDCAKFDFDLAWTRSSTLGFVFFAERISQGDSSHAGYVMAFQNGMRSVSLLRGSQDGGPQQVGEDIRLPRTRLGQGVRKTHVTVLADKKARKIVLQLDGAVVKEWTDSAEFTGGGKCLVFADVQDGVRIANIRVSRWNGRASQDEVGKAGLDALRFTNGDALSGKVAAIVDGKARLETAYAAPMEILLERIQEINLAQDQAGTARRQPGDLRLALADGAGTLTLAVAELTGGSIKGSSDNCGEIGVALAAVSKLEFKLPVEAKAGDEAKADKVDKAEHNERRILE